MKNRNHGLSEKELVQLLMADCESTGDIQAKLKKLFAGTIEQIFQKRFLCVCRTNWFAAGSLRSARMEESTVSAVIMCFLR
jgi:hypothetical protein